MKQSNLVAASLESFIQFLMYDGLEVNSRNQV